MNTVELEVRCCCTPTRLYGYLTVPEYLARSGNVLHMSWCTDDGEYGILDLPVATFTDGVHYCDELLNALDSDTLAAAAFEALRSSARRLAIKFEGDDMSPAEKLALLRRLRGFREAPRDP